MFPINYITNIRHKKKTIETIVLALNRIEKTEKKNTNVTPSVKNIVQYYSVTDKKKESTAKLHSIPKRTVKRGHNITIMVLNSNLKCQFQLKGVIRWGVYNNCHWQRKYLFKSNAVKR